MKNRFFVIFAILVMALALVGCDTASPAPAEREGTDDVYFMAAMAMNHYYDVTHTSELSQYVTIKDFDEEPNPDQKITTVTGYSGTNPGGEGAFTLSVKEIDTKLENGGIKDNLTMTYNGRVIHLRYTYSNGEYDDDAYYIWLDGIPYRYDRVPF